MNSTRWSTGRVVDLRPERKSNKFPQPRRIRLLFDHRSCKKENTNIVDKFTHEQQHARFYVSFSFRSSSLNGFRILTDLFVGTISRVFAWNYDRGRRLISSDNENGVTTHFYIYVCKRNPTGNHEETKPVVNLEVATESSAMIKRGRDNPFKSDWGRNFSADRCNRSVNWGKLIRGRMTVSSLESETYVRIHIRAMDPLMESSSIDFRIEIPFRYPEAARQPLMDVWIIIRGVNYVAIMCT